MQSTLKFQLLDIGTCFLREWSYIANLCRDGAGSQWSSFTLDVGEPAHRLRLLPSTAGFTLSPLDVANCSPLPCADAELYFDEAKSSTWSILNSLSGNAIALVNRWNYTATSLMGEDRLAITQEDKEVLLLNSTYVLALGNLTGFSIGSFGVWPHSFLVAGSKYPSLLDTMVEKGAVDVRAWSYTAGASAYSLQGSFIFGGVDTTRFKDAPPLTVSRNMSGPESLNVSVNVIVDTMLQKNMLASKMTALISSDIPELWLPQGACDQIASAYGLLWNSSLNRYLLNASQYSDLTRRGSTLQFQLAANSTSTDPAQTVSIDVPLTFIAQNVSIDGQSQTSFAIRRAANEAQYVLGRAFLQAAHLTVNHDNNSFLIRPARYFNGSAVIQSIEADDERRPATKSGTITGAVVGCVVFLVLFLGALMMYRRKYRINPGTKTEKEASTVEPGLLHDSQKPELPATAVSAPPAYRRRELSDASTTSEMDGIDTMLVSKVDCLPGISEVPEKKTPVEPVPVELEGSPGMSAELNAVRSAIPEHHPVNSLDQITSSRPCVTQTVSDDSSTGVGTGTLISTLSEVTETRGRSTGYEDELGISPLHSRNPSRRGRDKSASIQA